MYSRPFHTQKIITEWTEVKEFNQHQAMPCFF